jgi:hypothetical protein
MQPHAADTPMPSTNSEQRGCPVLAPILTGSATTAAADAAVAVDLFILCYYQASLAPFRLPSSQRASESGLEKSLEYFVRFCTLSVVRSLAVIASQRACRRQLGLLVGWRSKRAPKSSCFSAWTCAR